MVIRIVWYSQYVLIDLFWIFYFHSYWNIYVSIIKFFLNFVFDTKMVQSVKQNTVNIGFEPQEDGRLTLDLQWFILVFCFFERFLFFMCLDYLWSKDGEYEDSQIIAR